LLEISLLVATLI